MAIAKEYPLSQTTTEYPNGNGHVGVEQKLGNHTEDQDQSREWESIDASVSAGNARRVVSSRRRRRKDDSLTETLRSWVVNHQIGLSINLLLLLALTHVCFPRARRRTRKFFELSYYDSASGQYTRGVDDFYFVSCWIIIFTGLRAAAMTYMLVPFAEWCGVQKTKTKVRFTEQAWLILYYVVFWSLGMYLVYNSKFWWNLKELWTDFPVRLLEPTMKWYYLVQFAFWLQQIVVVHIEDRRKDHWQMFTHHIVTCFLLLGSYGYYQTRVGSLILCLMDVVDLIFPVAKMLKYTGHQLACDIAFGVFIVTWFIARHVLYLMVCWSIYVDVPPIMVYGCSSSVTGQHFTPDGGSEIMSNVLQPFLDREGPICYNERLRYAFLSLLLVLQGITLMWFGMIVRVAVRVLSGAGADDTRSDDEEGEDEDIAEGPDDETDGQGPKSTPKPGADKASVPVQLSAPIEQTVGVDGLNLRQRRSSPRYRSRKPGSHAGGLSIAGHSDRKELLGRIGCDKPT